MAPTCTCRPVSIHIPTAMAVPSASFFGFSPMDIVILKKALREKALARRAALDDRAALSRKIAERFLGAIPIPKDAIVSSYIAIGDEADPAPLIDALRAQGHRIALPRVVGKALPLAFHLYAPDASLVPGVFGLSQPAADWPEAVPDVLAVPLLAFDPDGNRLGYGAGFYDRTLKLLRSRQKVLAVGYAFAQQEVQHVPHHDGDQKLDWVVTEHGARRFG
jgi:5-formyltetrahydrofolate cyclo-ligase